MPYAPTVTMIFVFLFFALSLQAQQRGNIYAVIVGVSEYTPGFQSDLYFAHSDAIAVFNLLSQHTHPSRLRLLTNQNATRDNVLRAKMELFIRTTPDDAVIFFFAGHGTQGIFAAHDRPIFFSEIQRIFQRTPAQRKMIFADACNSGDLRTGNRRAQQQSNNSLGGDVMLFLSSRDYQLSWEMYERLNGRYLFRNGIFTHYLLSGLRGGADANRDRAVTARELFDYVNPRVRARTNGIQVPVMWGRFDSNMVIIAP